MLQKYNSNIIKEAKAILEKDGIDKALAYLKSKDVQDKEAYLKKQIKEFAQKYILQAQLLKIKNRYKEAKEALKKALEYDNSIDTKFEYALFLQEQNYFSDAIREYKDILERLKENPKVYKADVAMTLNNLAILYSDNNQYKEAEKAYKEALEIYKELAKENPKVYKADVAMTLNNLAILYIYNNQYKEAEKVYKEALEIRRELAKENPKVFGIDYANTIVLGVYLLKNKIEAI